MIQVISWQLTHRAYGTLYWLLSTHIALQDFPKFTDGNDNYCNSNSHVNHILVDRYFWSDSSETKFRAIYLKMTMLFCEYYAMSPKPLFASNRSKKTSFKTFYCMNWCIFYISIYWILFHSIWLRIGTDINFQIFFELIMIFTFFESQETPEARICEPAVMRHTQLSSKTL